MGSLVENSLFFLEQEDPKQRFSQTALRALE